MVGSIPGSIGRVEEGILMITQVIGLLMVSSPFVVMFVVIWVKESFWTAVSLYVSIAVLVTIIWTGCELMGDWL